jgi:hypothetical protein
MDRSELEGQIIEKAIKDPAFRKALLASPGKAIGDMFGIDIPDEIEIQVFVETPTRFCLILPPESDELSEDELEMVSGGESYEPRASKTMSFLLSLRPAATK